MSDTPPHHSGFIAVVGRPNAGKSTLVNHIVGTHVAIVSAIAQTTRRVVRAVAHRDNAQMIFVDLPGSQKPVDRMTSRMQRVVEKSFGDVDVVLWIIDGSEKIGRGESLVADMVFRPELPVVIALNKIDLMDPAIIAKRIGELSELIGSREYHAIVPISATSGESVDALIDEVAAVLPEGPQWYGADDITDMRDDERIAEYIREAMLSRLRDELPHASMVTVDDIEESVEFDRLEVHCTIWVERKSQVGIIVGKGGEGIRDIGTQSRKVIERAIDRKIHLDLRVKMRKRWRDDDQWLERAGL